MVAFSKFFLIGDLIVTPILQAVEALPTELVGYIGGYVNLKAERLRERYENVLGELENIKRRTDADWAEYAKANLTRFGWKETPKCFKDSKGHLYKKAKPDDLYHFSKSFMTALHRQGERYLTKINNQYVTLLGYGKRPTALGQKYRGLDGQVWTAFLFCGKQYRKPDVLIWNRMYGCQAALGRCYCERCDSS